MRIYDSITIDIESGEMLDSVSTEWSGPVALCGDAGMGDFGGAAVADATGDTGDVGDVQVDEPQGDTGDIIGEIEPQAEGEEAPEGETAEGEPGERAAAGKEKEILPQQLAKALRELKQSHSDNPEVLRALKELQTSHYTARGYKELGTIDELRTQRAALEAIGGTEGIAQMRNDIDSIQNFDRMAAEGNPKVIEGLAEEFPDGFKRLVGPTLQKLSTMDPGAYRETMRGPLLQMLEGDGLIDVIGSALEELKSGSAEGSTRAQRELGRIAAWYNGLKEQEKEFQGRYKDPRVNQFAQEKQQLQQEKLGIYKEAVRSDLNSYLSQTMGSEITKILAGKPVGSRQRFESNVKNEVYAMLQANSNYVRGINDLCNQGKRDEAVRFAKPFIDAARRQALPAVYKDFFGGAPTTQLRKPAPVQRPQNGERQPQASDKPVPVRGKPEHDAIDWKKTSDMMFITNRAVLKSGKTVQWGNTIQR